MKSSENYKSMLNFRNAMEKVLSAYSETVIYTDFIYTHIHTQIIMYYLYIIICSIHYQYGEDLG